MNARAFSITVRRSMLALGVSSVALGAPALAQEAATAPLVDAGEIVVTARKTNERLQDVPISVSALSGDQLRENGAVDVKDVLRNVPGLSFSNVERGLGNYNIRGVSTVASSPTVGIYLDDISLVTVATGFSGAFDPIFFDMERLEVLKGPQGTLYGGSAMGGAIKYVSARPDTALLSGSAAAGFAATAHGAPSYNVEGILNLPLVTDTLAMRTGFLYRREGGYIDNAPGTVRNSNYSSTPSPDYTPLVQDALSSRTVSNHNKADSFVGRLSFQWEPDATWSIRPALFYQRYEQKNPSQFFLGDREELTSSFRLPQSTVDKAGIYSLDVGKSLGNVDFASLTAYFDRTLNWERDYSFFIGGLVPPLYSFTSPNLSRSRTTQFSQELRLSSGGPGDRFKWVAGLYYSHQDDNLYQIASTPGATPIIGTEVGYVGDTTTKAKQYAAFGEATFSITDRLDVTAGVRLFQIKQVVDILGDGPFNGGLTLVEGRKSNEKGVNPKVGISYKATPENMIFASAAKGFRPGGPNRFQVNPVLCAADLDRLGLTAAPDSFDSDNLWSYELGTKNQFADGRVTLNGALFFTDWKKIQQQLNLINCGFSFTGNAGSAEVKGAEIEGRVNVAGGFQIGGNATYTSAKITDAAVGTAVQDDDQVLAVPKWMASAFASYGFDVGADWRAQVRAEYQYQSSARRMFDRVQAVTFSDAEGGLVPNLAEFRESYDVVNASISADNGATVLRLYVNNLLDAQPWLDVNLGAGNDAATTLRPRTIGVEVRQKF
ncbi:TonB-dependent receptor [Sphingosinicella soli]|uniref:Outer membrane receptor protein involved in Fe transport n=1 Tax=Sphingosinicella soli TaxID=333708 RepID=A0A7W7F6D1_9SPHN|nr:TonB-dependent receptor [Sphingosinicella soli]MBB4631447.1 outer membrane receptor protein involved in Fe transport [Sphingosinicella soli]